MKIGIVGGGLAGLAEHGHQVSLFEAKRSLGGRAGSWREPSTGAWLDHCQHVSMGCCTNLADFLDRAGLRDLFHRFEVMHFIDRHGRQSDFGCIPWLPAPLHLAKALVGMRFLHWSDRLQLAWTFHRLARTSPQMGDNRLTILDWLRKYRTSDALINQFWQPVLVSALSERLDRIAFSAARKVLVDGFMGARKAFFLEVPQVPLGELYDEHMRGALLRLGVSVQTNTRVKQVCCEGIACASIELNSGVIDRFDQVIVAVPWRQAASLLSPELRASLNSNATGPQVEDWERLESGSIAAVHLWFDRPIMQLPHAVLLEQRSQWIFARGLQPVPHAIGDSKYYYQVVISAAHDDEDGRSMELADCVVGELRAIFPEAKSAQLAYVQVVAQPHAVFSPTAGSDAWRPPQATAVGSVTLAGDWTRTGWPATMEGAVISGYRAAECILAQSGVRTKLEVESLPREWLARWLIRDCH
ncbi:MAG: hydroxysqualene dehydroxylase HpnE [Planctomycetota bacterium]|nr:hydroxysqualene dehydroxylase HpnE [Planctomycetota bacterium]